MSGQTTPAKNEQYQALKVSGLDYTPPSQFRLPFLGKQTEWEPEMRGHQDNNQLHKPPVSTSFP
jgi:hypothetical protein